MIKNFFESKKEKIKNAIFAVSTGLVAAIGTSVNALAAEGGDVSMDEALSTGVSILDKGYTFVTGHKLLLAVACMGLIYGAVKGIKRMI